MVRALRAHYPRSRDSRLYLMSPVRLHLRNALCCLLIDESYSTAVRMNSLPLVTFFLARSASAHLHHTAYTSTTPLSIAASSDSLSIVALLVSSGARVDRGNVLHAAVISNHP